MAIALDIHGQGLYSSYSYNYPMVELQETLFRNSSDLDTINSQKELVVLPLNRGAKTMKEYHREYYLKNKRDISGKQKEYRLKNKEKIKQYYRLNRKRILFRCKERYEEISKNAYPSNILCKCGCNQKIIIKPYHRLQHIEYIKGHFLRGKIPSEKQREKTSITLKNKYRSGELKHWNKGNAKRIKLSCFECNKIFEVKLLKKTRKFCSLECYRKDKTIKTICLNCSKSFVTYIANKGKYCSYDCFYKSWLNGKRNLWNKGKTGFFSSLKGKTFEQMYGIEKAEQMKKMLRYNRKYIKISTSFTKPERLLMEIIKKHKLPFKYTGDGSFWIEYLNPDFVDCDGKKIALEVFGDYWHNPLMRIGLKWHKTEVGRKEVYKKYGWKSIILWEKDIYKGEEYILNKLKGDKQ